MADKKYPIITISRQYGAGGRTIARGLQDRLGIPFYDRDFVKKTAAASGYSEEDINAEGEQVSRASRFVSNLINPVTYQSAADGIYQAQKEIILDLAKEPAIIIGRCANVILKDAGVDCFNIFLYADIDHRIKRAEELAENNGMEIRKYIAKRDERRAAYYKTYTGREMGNYHDYDICLDTGRIGNERCIDILVSILEDQAQ